MVASMVGHLAANLVGKMECLMVAHSVEYLVGRMVAGTAEYSASMTVVLWEH